MAGTINRKKPKCMPVGLWGEPEPGRPGRTVPRFDDPTGQLDSVTVKTLQSPVWCLDIFDQILKRWNLIVCGPELRSGSDMQTTGRPGGVTDRPGSEKCDCIPGVCVTWMVTYPPLFPQPLFNVVVTSKHYSHQLLNRGLPH